MTGGLLACGAQGPTSGLYGWMFVHIPGFKVMREPDKFAALLCLSYAVTFGPGAAVVIRAATGSVARVLCACCVAAVPLVYGYTEFWGFIGYARPISYPVSWAAADRTMTAGATAIALPWRAYLQVPWAANRVIASPLPGYFDRPVISADDLEAGPIATESADPRTLFLQFAFGEGHRLSEFGRVLAPFGVRYVILARFPGAQSYDWLARQRDLTRVYSSSSIIVYKIDEAVPGAYAPRQTIDLRNWGQVLALSQRVPLTDYLIRVRHAAPGPVSEPSDVAAAAPRSPASVKVTNSTPVSGVIDVPAGTGTIVLSKPAYAHWQMPGFRPVSQFGAALAFTSTRKSRSAVTATVGYGPWQLVRECDAIGAGLAAADVALLIVLALRRRRRKGLLGQDPADALEHELPAEPLQRPA